MSLLAQEPAAEAESCLYLFVYCYFGSPDSRDVESMLSGAHATG